MGTGFGTGRTPTREARPADAIARRLRNGPMNRGDCSGQEVRRERHQEGDKGEPDKADVGFVAGLVAMTVAATHGGSFCPFRGSVKFPSGPIPSQRYP